MILYSLQKDKNWGKAFKLSINEDFYSHILDLKLMSDEERFKLIAACQVSGIPNIDVFELGETSEGKHFTIAYTKQPEKPSHLTVTISNDGK